jgi:hypothetical protein
VELARAPLAVLITVESSTSFPIPPYWFLSAFEGHEDDEQDDVSQDATDPYPLGFV